MPPWPLAQMCTFVVSGSARLSVGEHRIGMDTQAMIARASLGACLRRGVALVLEDRVELRL